MDSIITENNPGHDTILIKSKTNESLYKYCDGPDLEKFLSFHFSEGDKTEILNRLRTARSISLKDIVFKNEKVKFAHSITTDWLQIRTLRSTKMVCFFSTPIFISGSRCIFAYDISGLGGGLTLFKKEKSKWSVDINFCEWYE